MANWYFNDKVDEVRELSNSFLRSKDFFKTQKALREALEGIALDQRKACEDAIIKSNMFQGETLSNILSIIRNTQIK